MIGGLEDQIRALQQEKDANERQVKQLSAEIEHHRQVRAEVRLAVTLVCKLAE